ncbi:cupin domain-containing protein [Myxosarcina sp. GI1]|uniref:cupin domain-containing protein n=1 Tax=Myxosarcina sp. GI1 TaxID=1541065 RepID=UPI00056CB8B2|nr:cupin domain-containing protein [Myxosarcina sp. GI1]
MANIFDLPTQLPPEELFQTLFNNKNILIERIVSTGQTTLPGEWYDQERDEWVILIQGEAKISFQNDLCFNLDRGDYLYIPAHQKHRVEYTSAYPACIWLAIHFK